ncbi:hypothetical protein [Methanosarcina sp.]|uniref:hypothetical protein n=1 Tax=Methanosarcina sp. TaxID=2213 RepID=UPI003C7131D1
MKKYGRMIRKSYFPDLFFKQNGKSSSQGKIHVSVRIKFNIHKTLFWKKFFLSYPGEKHYGNSGFLIKCIVFGLKSTNYTHEKTILPHPEPGKDILENLIYRVISPEFSSRNFTFSKPIPSESISFNLVPVKLASPKITASNLQPSNLTSRESIISKVISHDHLSANSISNLKLLKIKFFENNSRVTISKTRSKIQILRSHENFLYKENDLFFTHPGLPVARDIVVQKVGPAADSSNYPLHPILAMHNFFPKIHNGTLSKIKESELSGREILFSGDILALRPGIGIISSRTFNILLESVRRSFNPRRLKQKPTVRETTVETVQARQYFDLEQSKKKIWEKKHLIQKVVKQDHRELIYYRLWRVVAEKCKPESNIQILTDKAEVPVLPDLISDSQTLPDSRRIQNLSISPLIQFVIRNFPKKNAFFHYWKYSSDSESNALEWKITQKHKTSLFKFSKDEHRKAFQAGGVFAAKKAIIGKKIPVKFSKNFFVFRKGFLQEYAPGFHNLRIQKTSGLFTLIENQLLIGKNELLSLGASNHELISLDYQSERSLGYVGFERIFSESIINAYRKFPRAIAELRTGFFEKILLSSIKKQAKSLQSVLKLNSSCNLESKNSGRTIIRMFDCLTTFAYNIVPAPQLYRQETNQPVNRFFSTDFRTVIKSARGEFIPELNIQRVLLACDKPTYAVGTYTIDPPASDGLNRTSVFPYSETQDLLSNGSATPIRSLQETNIFSSLQKLILCAKSAYTGISQITGALNYSTTSTQSYPAFSAFIYEKVYPFKYYANGTGNPNTGMIHYLPMNNYIHGKAFHSYNILNHDRLDKRIFSGKRTGSPFSSLSFFFQRTGIYTALSKKDILELYNILYSPSGTNTPAVAKYFMKSKTNRSSLEDRILLKGLFSGRSLDTSVPLISKIIGTYSRQKAIQACRVSRIFTLRVPQSSVFAGLYGALSATETESLNAGEDSEWTDKTHVDPESRNRFKFSMKEETGESIEVTSFWTNEKNNFFHNVSWPQSSRDLLLKRGHVGMQDARNCVYLFKKLGILNRINGVSGKKVQDLKSIGFSQTIAVSGQKFSKLAFNANKYSKEENIISHNTFFSLRNLDLHYASSYEGSVIGSVEGNEKGKAIIERGEELVLRTPVMYASKNTPENIEDNPDYTSKKAIHFLPERNNSYRVSPDLVNTIFDKIYRRLEAKLLIEKERRGLR